MKFSLNEKSDESSRANHVFSNTNVITLLLLLNLAPKLKITTPTPHMLILYYFPDQGNIKHADNADNEIPVVQMLNRSLFNFAGKSSYKVIITHIL